MKKEQEKHHEDPAHTHGPFIKDYAAQVYPDNYRPPEYLEYLERAAAAIKTVRIIALFTMLGFILLAAYGFFLIYSLTSDVHRMVDQSVRMTEQMQSMSRIMSNMHESMSDMRVSVQEMRGTIGEMNQTIGAMSNTLAHMSNTVTLMQHSARSLDQSIGPVMGTMNNWMPFGAGGNNYNGPPPYAPPLMR
jgi:TolA-binding protein